MLRHPECLFSIITSGVLHLVMGMDTNTLIAIDKSYLDELDDNYLYALDIYLDKLGKSELVYDFPDKPWEEVWTRNSKIIIEFCKARKMIIFQ